MKRLILFLFIVSPVLAEAQDKKITTFILVRHAEKENEGKDPELSQDGAQRALRLSELLKNSAISAVYSTNFKRTLGTVGPLSNKIKVSVSKYDRMTIETLEDLAKENEGRTILIAGHSNTIPQMANALLGENVFQNFPDTEYGIILIISILEVGKVASVVRINY